jgi:hypothetical protein
VTAREFDLFLSLGVVLPIAICVWVGMIILAVDMIRGEIRRWRR